ncbi:MAG TPA: RNA polymerase sigma factor [Gaiellaceae bacterium]|nr:RNA polymerase sigma factor [Gaiellaceae bacterium]
MRGHDRWSEIELVYREGFSRYVRVARAIAGDRETAAEAVQEGFADALRRSDQFSGRGSLEGWVWRCVLNRARKARARPPQVVETEAWSDAAEPDPDLRAQLAGLPERQRLVVFLRYFADLSYGDIGEALGIEVGTVSATLHAAHAALRTELEEAHA